MEPAGLSWHSRAHLTSASSSLTFPSSCWRGTQDLLYKATSVLLPWKVSLLYRALRQLTPLWPSLHTHLHTEHHGIRLSLFETRVSMTVNVKTGTYVVTSNMSAPPPSPCPSQGRRTHLPTQ